MFKQAVNVSRRVSDFTKNIIENESDDLEFDSEQELVNIINVLFDISLVKEVSDIFTIELSDFTPGNTFCIKDENLSRTSNIFYHNNILIENNEYYFVVCLIGNLYLSYSTGTVSSTIRISEGEVFMLSISANYFMTTEDTDMKLLVIRCNIERPFIHFVNTVFCEDSAIYDKYSGYNFALFRLKDEVDNIVEDVIITRGKICSSKSMEEISCYNIKRLLSDYSLDDTSHLPDHVPKNKYRTDRSDVIELAVNYEDVNKIMSLVTPKTVYSSLGKKFKSYIVYGVACRK